MGLLRPPYVCQLHFPSACLSQTHPLDDDKMNGDVVFVSAAQGASERLAYVDPTTNRAIIKVDNSSFVPWNEKRRSVRITSKESYGIGSLWIADMYHMPYGVCCSTSAFSGTRELTVSRSVLGVARLVRSSRFAKCQQPNFHTRWSHSVAAGWPQGG